MKLSHLALATALAAGALAAQAHEKIYLADLDGPSEAPPNSSPGIGTAKVTFDLDLVTMRVEASFSGLTGNVTAAHIHCCTSSAFAGTAIVASVTPTFTGFPSGATFGTYDKTFDMTLASSYNATFITNNGGTVSSAMNALLSGMDNGKAYLNIHTSTFGGGEIRGFLVAAPVPEPESYALLLAGLGLVGAAVRRQVRRPADAAV
jgi:CHRD domain/PEP-CTERM motif